MYKVVINRCYGGFSLSPMAEELYLKYSSVDNPDNFYSRKLERHDPILIRVVEELGKDANNRFSELVIVELDSNQYRIEEYDGMETVYEQDSIEWIYIND